MADSPGTVRSLRQENDFILKKVELIVPRAGGTYDMKLQRAKVDISQDIYTGSMVGEMDVFDSMDMPQMMPFLGDEKIRFVFTRYAASDNPDVNDELPDFDMTFRIYSVSGRTSNNTKAQTYTIHFVSEEFIKNFKTRIKMGFKDTTYSDMVQKVYDQKIKTNKPIVVEKTKYEYDFVSPNITAFELFNQLASKSLSDEGNGPAYFFYEDTQQFNFVSIGKLLQQEPAEKYIYQVANVLDEAEGLYKPRTIASDMIRAQNYRHTGTFNTLKNLASGMYGSHAITIDPIRRMIKRVEFDITQEFDKFKHLHPVKPFTDDLDALKAPDAHMRVVFTNKDQETLEWIGGKDASIKSSNIEEYLLHRTSYIHQMNTTKMGIVVSGDPRRKAGEIIEFLLPQNMGNVNKENPQELDSYLQGKFLITAIKHTITTNSYQMHMEIVKDTFFSDIKHVDPTQVYKNIF
jgi:hypothetical protein